MTNGELLRKVGEALFGTATWRAQMARKMGVNRKLIKDWETGRWPISETTWLLLALEVRTRQDDLMDAAQNLHARLP